eukprot:jgi/Chrzof1/15223/Cz09g32020.t1
MQRMIRTIKTQQVKRDETSTHNVQEHMSMLKRLIRELFSEQLNIKARMTTLETAANTKHEAAEDYRVGKTSSSSGTGGTSSSRRSVHVSGHVSAAGLLAWSREGATAEAGDTTTLHDIGAQAHADMSLYMHSVFHEGRKRLTAKLSSTSETGMTLQQLLYRAQVNKWLHIMVAPIGGCLEAVARQVMPFAGQYGVTSALQKGHGLSAVSQGGGGAAVTALKGPWSLTAGQFMSCGSPGGPVHHTGAVQLGVHTQSDVVLTLVAAHLRQQQSASASSSNSGGGQAALRFLGPQLPAAARAAHHADWNTPSSTGDAVYSSSSSMASRTVLGVAGACPIADMFAASAWAEVASPLGGGGGGDSLLGQCGWGVALFAQPDVGGQEVGLVIAQHSDAAATAGINGGGAQEVQQRRRVDRSHAPVLCELSCKLPMGDGLALSPSALLSYRGNKGTSMVLAMQSSWKF